MPLEPRHGQRIPTGRLIGRQMARVLAAMRRTARQQVLAGKPVNLSAYIPVIVLVVMPGMMHEYALGAEYARRRIRYAVERRRRSGRKNFLPVGLVGSQITAQLNRPVSAVANALQAAWNTFRPEVSAAVQAMALELAGEVTASTVSAVRNAVRVGLEAGESVASIARKLSVHFEPSRAMTIGMTEASRAMHAGQVAAARSSGVVKGMKWLASSDACSECEKLNRKVVPLGEPFYVDPKGGPYAVVYAPPRHPSCACSTTEVIDFGEGGK